MKKVSSFKIAQLYANAMYEGAQSVFQLDELYRDAQTLREMSDKDFKLLMSLDVPLINGDKKKQRIDNIIKSLPLCSSMVNTLRLLATNGKLKLTKDVVQCFISLYQDKHQIAEVYITTVEPLSKSQEKRLIGKLEAVFGKKVIINYEINPNIIGGLVIRYGSTLIDNSIKNKLDTLELLMKGTK